MIRVSDVFKIGKFGKPHGIKGEISFSFENDIFDRKDCPYLICDVEGILVPFFIKEYRFKGSETALITLEDVKSDTEAKRFKGLDVYFPREYMDENEDIEFTLDFFIGFSIIDEKRGTIGKVIDIDESTINTLFLVEDEHQNEIIIPASDDFVTNIDEEKKILYLDLPEGLIDDSIE